jgi:hypothetical protein
MKNERWQFEHRQVPGPGSYSPVTSFSKQGVARLTEPRFKGVKEPVSCEISYLEEKRP